MTRVFVIWLNPLIAWLQDGFSLLPEERHATLMSFQHALRLFCHSHLKCPPVLAFFSRNRYRISSVVGYSRYHLPFSNTCTNAKLFLHLGIFFENMLASCTLLANRFCSSPPPSQDSMFHNCNLPEQGINRTHGDDAIRKQISFSMFSLSLAEELVCFLVLVMRNTGNLLSLASLESSKRTALALLSASCLPLRLFSGLIRLLDRLAKELSSPFVWESILAHIAALPVLPNTLNSSSHDFQSHAIFEAWVS
jgi:hypothetical protein